MSLLVEYEKQRGDRDCGIAALCMVTGIPYEEVLKPFTYRLNAGMGINETHVKEFLYRNGFAYQLVYQHHQYDKENTKRAEWPVKPWAPAHILLVLATRDYHFTAMDHDGVMFDPWDENRDAITDPAYREIHWMMGIWDCKRLQTQV